MTETNSVTKNSGYLSEEGKKRFTIIAGILGAVFFFAQFVLPFLLMPILMIPMTVGGFFEMWEPKLNKSALHNGKIYYVTQLSGPPPVYERKTPPIKLICIDEIEEKPKEIASLEIKLPWLVSDNESLWIISSDQILLFKDNKLTELNLINILGDISKPFFYRNSLFVIENRPDGQFLYQLQVNGGVSAEWKLITQLNLGLTEKIRDIGSELIILPINDTLHIFLLYGDTLYHKIGLPPISEDESNWSPVVTRPYPRCPFVFNPFVLNGNPAIIHNLYDTREIIGLKFEHPEWKEFFRTSIELPVLEEIQAFPINSEKFKLAISSFPFPAIEILTISNRKVTDKKIYGEETFFPKKMIPVMFIPYISFFILPLILAFILSVLMAKYRVLTYKFENQEVKYASLSRRAISQIIDAICLVFPLLFFFFEMFTEPQKFMRMEGGMFMFIHFLGLLLWAIFILILFSLLEGKWGITPGKLIVKIRVIGVDLKPCGFWRALIRNLLKLVDGFFNFLVGILLVAYTDNWQRIGDMAVRTIVVSVKENGKGYI